MGAHAAAKSRALHLLLQHKRVATPAFVIGELTICFINRGHKQAAMNGQITPHGGGQPCVIRQEQAAIASFISAHNRGVKLPAENEYRQLLPASSAAAMAKSLILNLLSRLLRPVFYRFFIGELAGSVKKAYKRC